MLYQVIDDNDDPLNAHLSIDSNGIDFNARGGTKNKSGESNTDYKQGLSLIIERLKKHNIELKRIWVNSNRVQNIPISSRTVLSGEESKLTSEEIVSLIGHRSMSVGQTGKTKGRTNSKKLRIEFHKQDIKTLITQLKIRATEEKLKVSSKKSQGKFSWKLLDDGKVIKILDKSSFTQNETPIDKKFGYFFNFDDNTSSSNITISHKSHTYDVALKRRKGSTSMRMTWGSEFGEVLKGFFKGWETREAYDGIEGMKLQFTQLGEENSYKVDMIPVGSFADSAIQFDESVDNLYGTLKEVPEGQKNPESNEKTITVYKRDPEVKASVLQSAKGYCELCEDKAFLKSKNNIPYLEVHHLRKLSDNGSDTVTNAVAICANCHRKLHYANNRDELLNDLYNKVSRLVRE